MKKLKFKLGACLSCCALLVVGCNDQEPRNEDGGRRPTPTTPMTDAPNDGSVLCPGDPICPIDSGAAARPPWAGVLIPPSVVTDDNIVCIAGQNAPDPPCPPGWSGRLWKPVGANIQTVCRPGSTEPACQAGGGGYYGFFCRDNKQKCPGLPKRN